MLKAITQRPREPALLMLGILLVIAQCFAAFGSTLSYWFTGVDVLPLILSNRFDDFTSFFSIFSNITLSEYSAQVLAAPPSVRPVGQLLFAMDYLVWGLNPFGYHLTNLLMHAVTSVLIIFLVRGLGFSQWRLIGILAAALFAIHPVHASVVPSIETRYEILLGVFTLTAIIMALKYFATGKLVYLLIALLSVALALGSKETGVMMLPVMAALALYMRTVSRISIVSILWLLGLMAAITVGFLGYRWWVVGDAIGGYATKASDFAFLWRLSLAKFYNPLLHFLLNMGQPILQKLAKLIMLGSTMMLALVAALGLFRSVFGKGHRLFSVVEDYVGSDWRPMTLVSCWLLLFLGF